MSQHTYGIVGTTNCTVTMCDTVDDEQKLSHNQSGEKLPEKVITRRRLSFHKHRLGHVCPIFPV